MPTIAFKTRIRTVSDNCILDLVVCHRLVAGEPSAAPRVVKHPPDGVDIVLVSPLTITTSGTLNNRKIPAEALISSRIAQHLPDYLKLNSSELGFDVVSDAHIAEDTGLMTFFCTASRPSRVDVQLPHLKLLGFDIDYSWHETPSLSSPETPCLLDSVLTPFSSCLSLPYLTALNVGVERFVALQMVKRYPRFFGSWSQQLDMETPLISSIFTSLSNILRRSSNLHFQDSYRTRLRMLKQAMLGSIVDSENRLSGYLESSSSLDANKCRRVLLQNEENIFTYAMERAYCLAMKRCKFKSNSHSQNWPHPADDIFCDQQPLFIGFEELHSGASDEEASMDDRGSLTLPSLSEDFDFNLYDSLPPGFSSILDSSPADPGRMFLTMAECLEHVDIFAAKVSDPTVQPPLHKHVGCSTNNALTDQSHFTPSQDISSFTLVTEDKCDADSSGYSSGDVQLEGSCFGQDIVHARSVNGWDSSTNGLDFVAMEF